MLKKLSKLNRLDYIRKRKEKQNMSKKKHKSKIFEEFKAFLSRGNAFDMAVGVVIGGAFSSIVTAIVNILISVCTWGVPGGIKGLVTPLPAANNTQRGIEGIGQFFKKSDIVEMTIKYAESQGYDKNTLTVNSDSFTMWQSNLLSNYTLHGDTYFYNGTAIIDWGTAINAVISFLIIGITLFVIVKVVNYLRKVRLEMEAKVREEYYEKHPEERPAPVEEQAPQPTEVELLTEIRDSLKNLNTK